MKAKLFSVLLFLAVLGFSPAHAITYDVNVVGLQAQECFPNCASFGSLTGTITTDGTLGIGLSPSIITGWNFSLSDGVNTIGLATANSFITYNFSDLLSATPIELDFNFSPNPPRSPQPNLEFTSSSNGARVVTIFAETDIGGSFPGIDPGGIGIALGFTGFESVTYLSGTQLIGTAETPLPAALPLFASGLGALGLLGWRRKRKGATKAAA
jgi:hypothetical protein